MTLTSQPSGTQIGARGAGLGPGPITTASTCPQSAYREDTGDLPNCRSRAGLVLSIDHRRRSVSFRAVVFDRRSEARRVLPLPHFVRCPLERILDGTIWGGQCPPRDWGSSGALQPVGSAAIRTVSDDSDVGHCSHATPSKTLAKASAPTTPSKKVGSYYAVVSLTWFSRPIWRSLIGRSRQQQSASSHATMRMP